MPTFADNGALQADTTAAVVALPAGTVSVMFQNLGPNAIYVGVSAANAATNKGIQVAASGGTISLDVAGNASLFILAATALQVSPLDTRWFAKTNLNRSR